MYAMPFFSVQQYSFFFLLLQDEATTYMVSAIAAPQELFGVQSVVFA
jgi:hypothetical protein